MVSSEGSKDDPFAKNEDATVSQIFGKIPEVRKPSTYTPPKPVSPSLPPKTSPPEPSSPEPPKISPSTESRSPPPPPPL